MRAWLLLLALAACDRPLDKIVDERILDRIFPLYTQVEPLSLTRVRLTAYVLDPVGAEGAEMTVIRCPMIGDVSRDIQCLAKGTEETLASGAAVQDDLFWVFSYDYELPPDLPFPFTERIMFRTQIHGEQHEQVADIPVGIPAFLVPSEPLVLVAEDDTEYTLDGIVAIPAGDYRFKERFVEYFCTPGCKRVDLDHGFRLRIEAAASPRLFVLGATTLQRFILQTP